MAFRAQYEYTNVWGLGSSGTGLLALSRLAMGVPFGQLAHLLSRDLMDVTDLGDTVFVIMFRPRHSVNIVMLGTCHRPKCYWSCMSLTNAISETTGRSHPRTERVSGVQISIHFHINSCSEAQDSQTTTISEDRIGASVMILHLIH